MGSEQSTQSGASVRTGLRRGKSVPDYKPESTIDLDSPQAGTISPEPSVCSDSELPYVSYTVNRPIGDSPKKKPRRLSRGKTLPQTPTMSGSKKIKKKPFSQSTNYGRNIVVVKEAAPQTNKYDDPDLQKLKEIPMFLPIMRSTLSLPAARDPEILEKLDSAALCNFAQLLENHLYACALDVSAEQTIITKKIVHVEKESSRVLTQFNETQKSLKKFAESLNTVPTMLMELNNCYESLNKFAIAAREINNFLPEDLRLESFELPSDMSDS